MNQQVLQFVLLLLGMVAVVSVVACLTYLTTRVVARRHLLLNLLGLGASLVLIVVLMILANDDLSYIGALVWLLVCSGLGSFFHNASSAKPRSWFGGFVLMVVVSQATLSLSFLALVVLDPRPPFFSQFVLGYRNPLHVDLALALAYICFTAPLVVTAFLRMWQVMKLRPGVDRHLDADLDRDPE